jgi:hypothetical protein
LNHSVGEIGVRLRLAVGILVLALGACSVAFLDHRDRDLRDLDRHRDEWRSQQIHSYAFEYNRSCFCPPEILRRARIEVRGDTVFRVTDVQSGSDVTRLQFVRWPTIDSLFASARRTISSSDWKYEIEYDPTFSYVRRLSGDIPNAVDDEFVETVYTFARVP